MRVLITRPQPEADAFAAAVKTRGHDTVIFPLLIFQSLPIPQDALDDADGIVITSGAALRALQEGADASFSRAVLLPLFCVGEATAQKAKAVGFHRIAEVAETAEALAKRLTEPAYRGLKLLYLAGRDRAFDLEGALADVGMALRTIEIYEMKPAAELCPALAEDFRARRIGGVILMSARTADIFMALCAAAGVHDELKSVVFFCMSNAIAAKLSGLNAFCKVAASPSAEALLDLLSEPPCA